MDVDTDMGGSAPAPDTRNARQLFVIQRCWHSGPQQYQPLDFLRLFFTQRDAEEAAYHSAHAWCRHNNPGVEPQVKTLLLPSYPAHNASGSSYGFISYGSLFWVRSLVATVVSPETGNCHHEGHAVVTEGVIGGTGNRNSRRGTEVPTGRVFLGNFNTPARMRALEACHYIMAQLGNHQISTNVATLPIGRPTDYSSGNFLKDWPPQVLQPSLMLTARLANQHKRHTISPSSSEGENLGIVVDCPFEMPVAKRRRRFFHETPNNAIVVSDADEVMMSYGVAGGQVY